MLTKLESDMITRYWGDIEAVLRASVPILSDGSEEEFNVILQSLLEDRLQAWVLCDVTAQQTQVYAIMITADWRDPGTYGRNLFIYALYGYAKIPDKMWQEGLATLRKYAKGKGYKHIVALTQVQRVIDIVKSLGGDVANTFITMEV